MFLLFANGDPPPKKSWLHGMDSFSQGCSGFPICRGKVEKTFIYIVLKFLWKVTFPSSILDIWTGPFPPWRIYPIDNWGHWNNSFKCGKKQTWCVKKLYFLLPLGGHWVFHFPLPSCGPFVFDELHAVTLPADKISFGIWITFDFCQHARNNKSSESFSKNQLSLAICVGPRRLHDPGWCKLGRLELKHARALASQRCAS